MYAIRSYYADLFPDLNNPRIVVEVQSGERPPEEMEKQFVEQIEGVITSYSIHYTKLYDIILPIHY